MARIEPTGRTPAPIEPSGKEALLAKQLQKGIRDFRDSLVNLTPATATSDPFLFNLSTTLMKLNEISGQALKGGKDA